MRRGPLRRRDMENPAISMTPPTNTAIGVLRRPLKKMPQRSRSTRVQRRLSTTLDVEQGTSTTPDVELEMSTTPDVEQRTSPTPEVEQLMSTTPNVKHETVTSSVHDIYEVGMPSTSSAGSSMRTRGPSRGLQLSDERPQVHIPTKWNAAVGPNASKFASEAGCRVRRDLRDHAHKKWSKMPELEKTLLKENMKNKFELIGEGKVIDNVVNSKFAILMRQNRHRLHKFYQKLVKERGEVFASANPPTSCTLDSWRELIKMWTTPKFIEISAIKKANRACGVLNHACGSKSMHVKANEMMNDNEGKLPDFILWFKMTRYNPKTKKWASPACEEIYDTMVRETEERALHPDLLPLTAEEMSAKYLHTRPGTMNGMCMKSSDQQSIEGLSQHTANEEIVALKEKLRQQQYQLNSALEWMKSMGYPGAPPPIDDGAGVRLTA